MDAAPLLEEALEEKEAKEQIEAYVDQKKRLKDEGRSSNGGQHGRYSALPSPAGPMVSRKEKIRRAAALLNAGLLGYGVDAPVMNPMACKLYASTVALRTCLLLVFLSVNIYEEPSWCGFNNGKSWCGEPGRNYRFFGLEAQQGHNVLDISIDAICIGVLLVIAVIRYVAYGGYLFFWSRGIYTLLLLTSLITSSVKAVYGFCVLPTAILRPFVVIFGFDRLRSLTFSVISVIPRVADIVLCLFLLVSFFGIFGVFLFRDRVLIHNDNEAHMYFCTFEESFINLFILFTTANNPDIMIPAYRDERSFFLFFAIFIVVSIFFLNNLILANVFDTYRQVISDQAREFHSNRLHAFRCAFRMLRSGSRKEIPRWVMHATLMELRQYRSVRFPTVPKIPGMTQKAVIEILITAMDQRGSSNISWREFITLPFILSLSFRPSRSKQRIRPAHINTSAGIPGINGGTGGELLAPERNTDARRVAGNRWERIRKFLKPIFLTWKYEVAMCVVVSIDFLVIVAELERPGQPRHTYLIIELLFTLVFFVECCIVFSVLRPVRYWRSWRRRWQLVTSIGSVILEIYVIVPNNYNDANILRYVVLVRSLRLIWLLYEIPRFHRVFRTMWRLVEPFLAVLGLLAMVMAVFASIGVHAFGGYIWEGNPDILKHAPAYVEGQYWPLNFNDFGGAFVVVFQLLVVNNWHVLMQGTVAAVGTKFAQIYFIAFYLIAVLISLNIVVAVMLSITRKIESIEERSKRVPVCVFKMHETTKEKQLPRDEKREKWGNEAASSDSRSHTSNARDCRTSFEVRMVDDCESDVMSIPGSPKYMNENQDWLGKRRRANSWRAEIENPESDFAALDDEASQMGAELKSVGDVVENPKGNIYRIEAYRRKRDNSLTSVYNVFGVIPDPQSKEAAEAGPDPDQTCPDSKEEPRGGDEEKHNRK